MITDPADALGALGAVLALLSGVSFYMGSPNRKVLVGRPLAFIGSTLGLLLSGASIVVLQYELSVPAAVFTWMTIAMFSLSSIPFVGVLIERRERRA